MKKLKRLILPLLIACIGLILPSDTAEAWDRQPSGVYSYEYGASADNSSIVWTTEPYVQDIEWNIRNSNGYTVYTSDPGSNIRDLSTGEHIKDNIANEYIYIGKWEYSTPGHCIHQGHDLQGVIVNPVESCGAYYPNRWIGYCNDCGEPICLLITGSESLMRSLSKIPYNASYYYLCPITDHHGIREGHMEQGANFEHKCKTVSANKYYVNYNVNAPSGSTPASDKTIDRKVGDYYYNNATTYENKTVVPNTDLESGNSLGWKIKGYKFVGWTTEPNGGTYVSTWLDVQNLQTEEWLNTNENTVNLYAQWEEWDITLSLDDEATDINKTKVIGLWEEYNVPDGVGGSYTIKLDADGGTLSTDTLTVTKEFDYWKKVLPFYGEYDQNTSIYRNTWETSNHSTVYLKAIYYPSTVILPTPKKEGYEFLGWEDEDGNIVAQGGDTYTVSKDDNLKASWNKVELSLSSVENYTANDGNGAVDLSWFYTGKTSLTIFKAFRSEANTDSNFDVVKSADSIAKESVINKKVTSNETYTVPESGFYTIEVYGGKGSNYGSYTGGNGGYVEAKVFLKKGQVLYLYPGTAGSGATNGKCSAGYNGGTSKPSNTTSASSGGAASVVMIDSKLFAVAGGGGAAGKSGNGGAGGNTDGTTLQTSGSNGQAGFASGGGGYLGGLGSTDTWTNQSGQTYWNSRVTAHKCAGSDGLSYANGCYQKHLTGSTTTHIDCPGHNVSVQYNMHHSLGNRYCAYCKKDQLFEGTCDYYTIYLCNGTMQDGQCNWGEAHCTVCGTSTSNTFSSPPSSPYYCSGRDDTTYYDYYVKSCGYNNGTSVLSCLGAYGGSNYLSSDAGSGYFISGTYQNSTNVGVNNGSGYITIKSSSVGFQLGTEMNGVYAPDVDAPNAPEAKTVTEEDVVTVEVDKTNDNGTVYYFYVQSFNMNDESVVTATSNKTYNKLTSGVNSIKYIVDTSEGTVINSSNINSATTILTDGTEKKTFNVTKTTDYQYAHIVYVDKAGNISDTLTVAIGSKTVIPVDGDPMHSHYEINTPTLTVVNAEDDGVYLNGTDLYVRADGDQVLTLKEEVSIPAVTDYFKINDLIFKEGTNDDSNHVYFPTNSDYTANDSTYLRGTDTYLEAFDTHTATVSEDKLNVSATQSFTIDTEETFTLIPRAEATCLLHEDATVSKEGSGYTVYSDNTAPEITVDSNATYEVGTYLDLGQIPEYKISVSTTNTKVTVTAEDAISGLRDINIYLGAEGGESINSGKNGYSFTATKDGVYEYIVIATDNVGNEKKIRITITVDLTGPTIYDRTIPEDNSPTKKDASGNDVENEDYIPKKAQYSDDGTNFKDFDDDKTTSTDHKYYMYTYDWVDHDILLDYEVMDSLEVKSIVLYRGWETSEVVKTGTINSDKVSGNIVYNVSIEGIDKYKLVVTDSFGHETIIYITTKIDYTAPVVSGLDLITTEPTDGGLIGLNVADSIGDDVDTPITVTIKADDADVFYPEEEKYGTDAGKQINDVSGLKEFTITITNTENGLTRVYSTDSTKAKLEEVGADGKCNITEDKCTLTKTEDSAEVTITLYDGSGEIEDLFKGDWTISVTAIDNVKNQTNVDDELGFFRLKATFNARNSNERLDLDGDNFAETLQIKNGEACILKIETDGYVDLLQVDLTDFYNAGYKVYRWKDGDELTDYWYNSDPSSDSRYNKDWVTEIQASYDFVRPDKKTSKYILYYELISPYLAEEEPTEGVYTAKVTAYKGINFNESDGKPVDHEITFEYADTNGDGKITTADETILYIDGVEQNAVQINSGISSSVEGKLVAGSPTSLRVETKVKTSGSIANNFRTTIQMIS